MIKEKISLLNQRLHGLMQEQAAKLKEQNEIQGQLAKIADLDGDGVADDPE